MRKNIFIVDAFHHTTIETTLYLLQAGHQVYAVIRKRQNIKVLQHPNLKVYQIDDVKTEDVFRLLNVLMLNNNKIHRVIGFTEKDLLHPIAQKSSTSTQNSMRLRESEIMLY